jgi:hypothetical protein
VGGVKRDRLIGRGCVSCVSLSPHQPHPPPTTAIPTQEGLPRFQRIAPDAVVPGIRTLQAQFAERFQQLEGAWSKEQVWVEWFYGFCV